MQFEKLESLILICFLVRVLVLMINCTFVSTNLVTETFADADPTHWVRSV